MPEAASRANKREYVSRDEFEVFERNVDRQFQGQSEALSNISRKLDAIQSTDWKTLGMFAGLILSIGALAASPFMRDLARIEGQQAKISEKVATAASSRWTDQDQREYEKGVLVETRRMEELIEKSAGKLDDQLQREMRLLDDALQREMRMLLDKPAAQLAAIVERVGAVENELQERQAWMSNHDTSVSALNARQSTKIEAVLERLQIVEEDLASRKGERFNRGDYYKDVLPVLDELRNRIVGLEGQGPSGPP